MANENGAQCPTYPVLVLISGPSAVGKDTIARGVIARRPDDFYFVVTATTRKPRENEIDGYDYSFVSHNEFARMIEDDELLEYAVSRAKENRIFRRFMAERSIAYVVVFLTIASTVLYMPIVGMFYGLHTWTAAATGGVVDAHFIAVVDTALESPLGQIAMIPMLAWIANSAPANLKATFFAVMASFTNLALSASQLGTKYLNQIFTVTREVRDRTTDAITVPADYSELGWLMWSAMLLGFLVPVAAVLLIKFSPWKSA